MTSIIDTNSLEYSELQDYLPEADYYHSTAIVNRHTYELAPQEGTLINPSVKSRSVPYNWIIQPTTTSLIHLQECYFDIVGNLNIHYTKQVGGEQGPVGEFTINTEDMLIPSDNWIVSLFKQSTLQVGGTTVSDRPDPIRFNVFNRLFFRGDDKNAQEGYAGINDFNVKNNAVATHNSIYNFSNGSIVPMNCKFNGDGSILDVVVPFTARLNLTDIVDCDDIVPIFNQEVKITLMRAPDDSVSIQTPKHFDITLKDINYAQLKVFKYMLDESVIQQFSAIYSTPKTVVFSGQQMTTQTVLATNPSGSYQINTPIGLLFGSKFMAIQLLKSPTTSITPGNYVPLDTTSESGCKPIDVLYADATPGKTQSITRYTLEREGPHATLPINYDNIMVQADGYTLLNDNVVAQTVTYPVKGSSKLPLTASLLNNINYYYTGLETNEKTDKFQVRTYSRLYREYCLACRHTGVKPVSHEIFINCFPSIVINLSEFSRISTQSNLHINIGNTTSYTADEGPYKHDGNEYNNLLITTYGLKAIKIEGQRSKMLEINNSIHNSYDDQVSVA